MQVEVAEERPHFFDDCATRCLHQVFDNRSGEYTVPETRQFSIAALDNAGFIRFEVLVKYFLHVLLKVLSPIADDLVH